MLSEYSQEFLDRYLKLKQEMRDRIQDSPECEEDEIIIAFSAPLNELSRHFIEQVNRDLKANE